jgi:hypothetical protein
VVFDLRGLEEVSSVNIPRTAVNRFADAALGMQIQFTDGVVSLTPEEVQSIAAQATHANVTIVMLEDGLFAVYSGNVRLDFTPLPPNMYEPLPTEPMPLGTHLVRVVIGQPIGDAVPFIDGIRTMVPVRFIADALGAYVSWDDATRTVFIQSGATVLSIPVDQPLPGDMGRAIITGYPARTFVPVRYVSEMLGAYVRWDGTTQAVYIYR